MDTQAARDRLAKIFEELRQQREALRVQMHRAQAEAKQEWAEVEKRWHEVEPKLSAAGREALTASKDIGADLGRLTASKDIGADLGKIGDEIAQAYQRIASKLR